MYRIQVLLLTPVCLSASADHHGDEPIDLIWVSLKPGCLADPE